MAASINRFNTLKAAYKVRYKPSIKRSASISHLKLICIAALTCLMLAACQEEMSPLIADSVSYKAEDQTWVEKPLSLSQLQALSMWLSASNTNWRRCYITPPGSTLRVTLKHADGSTSSLWQLNFTNTQNTLMAQHLSGSNLSDQPCALQSFSQKDINALRSLLGS